MPDHCLTGGAQVRVSEYNQLKGQLGALNRKRAGNLAVRRRLLPNHSASLAMHPREDPKPRHLQREAPVSERQLLRPDHRRAPRTVGRRNGLRLQVGSPIQPRMLNSGIDSNSQALQNVHEHLCLDP